MWVEIKQDYAVKFYLKVSLLATSCCYRKNSVLIAFGLRFLLPHFSFFVIWSMNSKALWLLKLSLLMIELPLDLDLSAGLLAFTLVFLKVSFGVFSSLTGKHCFESELGFPYPELLTTPWGPYEDFFLCIGAGLLIFLYNPDLVVIDSDFSFFKEQDWRTCDRAHLFKTSFRL